MGLTGDFRSFWDVAFMWGSMERHPALAQDPIGRIRRKGRLIGQSEDEDGGLS